MLGSFCRSFWWPYRISQNTSICSFFDRLWHDPTLSKAWIIKLQMSAPTVKWRTRWLKAFHCLGPRCMVEAFTSKSTTTTHAIATTHWNFLQYHSFNHKPLNAANSCHSLVLSGLVWRQYTSVKIHSPKND